MKDRRLTVRIAGDVASVDGVKHGGTGGEIKGDIIGDRSAGPTGDEFTGATILDVLVGDTDGGAVLLLYDVITEKPPVDEDIGQVTNGCDVVNGRHRTTRQSIWFKRWRVPLDSG